MTKGDLIMALEGYPDEAEVYIRSNVDGREYWWSGFTYRHGEPGEIFLSAQPRSTIDRDAK
jgi:hypothetical protein